MPPEANRKQRHLIKFGIGIKMKRLVSVMLAVALAIVISMQLGAANGAASGQLLLPVPSDAAGIPHGALNASGQTSALINVTLSLAFRNGPSLDALLVSLYTPGSGSYHHWLSPEQFYARFGPSPAAVSSVEAYMNSHGARMTGVSGDGTLLSFTASEAQLHRAFGVDFYSFSMGGSSYYSAKGQATLPYTLATSVTGIEGLQNFLLYTHPATYTSNVSRAIPSYVPPTQPSPISPYNPATIREAYNFTGLYGRGISGSGVSISIVTAFSFDNSTLQLFDSSFGITPFNVRQVQPYGAPPNTSLESTLDVEWMTAIAPNATINIVEGKNAQLSTFTSLFDYVVSHNLSSVVSTSWGTPESTTLGSSPSTLSADNNIFKQGAAQGIDFTTASGDYGANDNTSSPTPDFPSSSPWVTGVGGTWLNLTQSGKQVVRYSETAWNKSGGGVSTYFSRPSYQANLPGPLSLTGRGVPDVAFSAMPAAGYFVYYNGRWLGAGGTSFGAPIWAGILGLENQLRATAGEANLGFANPSLYTVASSSNYSQTFYDITVGNNGYYQAGTGYDLVTGLGSPNVNNLALLLARIPAVPLSVKAVATPSWGDSPLFTSLFANITGGFQPYSVKWYLNGTYNGTGLNHVVLLDGPAVYHFSAEVTDNVSATAASYVNVTVYQDNNSNSLILTASPPSGDANLSVQFSAALASAPLITVTSPYYLWAFGDSPLALNTSSPSAGHVYTEGGNFTVLATSFVPSGNSTRGYYTVQAMTVIHVAPRLQAVIKANRTGGSFPLHLLLEASQKGGTPGYTYSWSYVNETGAHSSTAPVVYVNYTTAGTFKVTLSARDSLNSTATATLTIEVYKPMAVTLTVSPSASGVAPFNATFSASVTGGAGGYYYSWQFENTTTASGNPVSHVFQSGGNKYIDVNVTDLAGDSVHANMTVSVQSLGLLNLLKGETALAVLSAAIIVAAIISYVISRRRKL